MKFLVIAFVIVASALACVVLAKSRKGRFERKRERPIDSDGIDLTGVFSADPLTEKNHHHGSVSGDIGSGGNEWVDGDS